MKIKNITKSITTFSSFFICSICVAADSEHQDRYDVEIIAKARVDEIFDSLYDPAVAGSGENVYRKAGFSSAEVSTPSIADGKLPRRNQSYVWGMTRKDNYLWFGTGANVSSLVGGVYYGAGTAPGSITEDDGITFSASEFGSSKFIRDGIVDLDEGDLNAQGIPALNPALGDWRPPEVLRYNLDTGMEENLYDNMTPDQQLLIWQTLGIRSAGYTANNFRNNNGLVFLAGPSTTAILDDGNGIVMFAFDANTGDCVGAQTFPEYSNIRQWVHFMTVSSTPQRPQAMEMVEFCVGSITHYLLNIHFNLEPSEFFLRGALSLKYTKGTSMSAHGHQLRAILRILQTSRKGPLKASHSS